ncbi:RidA family protein [Maridesulfovibrio ferrireducens]|uniref:RidA family protein n=1 Tax=Maridesulfovibrio ferrireducens TaxID=246191 RepID=UPI0011143FCF|nr:RidA family protein [Maridesulfovibrio ferrireducens]
MSNNKTIETTKVPAAKNSYLQKISISDFQAVNTAYSSFQIAAFPLNANIEMEAIINLK